MIISVASGKGGTGKTTVSVSLALSLKGKVQLADCDVEEPNAHIFAKPILKAKYPVYSMVPEIDDQKCGHCGNCARVCAYNAIAVIPGKNHQNGRTLVFNELCHGCGACEYFCPRGAITENKREIGVIEEGGREGVDFLQGKLNTGEAMSPPVIREVKRRLDRTGTVVIDAPPGTACPVITSIHGSDYCVLVTEPTPFGLNDLVLTVEVLKKMAIPYGVVINRSGLGDGKTKEYCQKYGIPILLEIPFKREIASSYSKGRSVAEDFPEYKKIFRQMFYSIKEHVSK